MKDVKLHSQFVYHERSAYMNDCYKNRDVTQIHQFKLTII